MRMGYGHTAGRRPTPQTTNDCPEHSEPNRQNDQPQGAAQQRLGNRPGRDFDVAARRREEEALAAHGQIDVQAGQRGRGQRLPHRFAQQRATRRHLTGAPVRRGFAALWCTIRGRLGSGSRNRTASHSQAVIEPLVGRLHFLLLFFQPIGVALQLPLRAAGRRFWFGQVPLLVGLALRQSILREGFRSGGLRRAWSAGAFAPNCGGAAAQLPASFLAAGMSACSFCSLFCANQRGFNACPCPPAGCADTAAVCAGG